MRQLPEVAEAVKDLDALFLDIAESEQYAEAGQEEVLAAAWDAAERRGWMAWIDQQFSKCRKDFRYACGNYFWLGQTREGRPTLIDLYDAQELFIEIVEKMWSEGRAARVICHKARQIGLSTAAESLMAWTLIYFEETVAMIIAQDPDQAEHLFRIPLYIYDHLPWWMQPMEASREFKEAWILDNPDQTQRKFKPGLNNWLIANACNKMSSFGQGKAIRALHASELPSWRPEGRAQEIIDGDIKYALPSRPGCFAVLEGKPKGVGGYWYNLWHDCEKKGTKKAMFWPYFVPAFFEKSRSTPAPRDFQPKPEEVQIRERYALEWRRCTKCSRPVPTNWEQIPECLGCGSTATEPVQLTDAQLYWYRLEKEKIPENDREAKKLFRQELCITSEEGFQAHGLQVFPDRAFEWLEQWCRPGEPGFFSEDGRFHHGKKCDVCGDDHTFVDHELQVWEAPVEGCRYVFGVDVSEGIEDERSDWTVIHGLRIGFGFQNPDTQVFEWRGKIQPSELARTLFILGNAYNNAMISIEVRGPGDTAQYVLMNNLGYSRIYRWKHFDRFGDPNSNKAGWWTTPATRKMIIANGIEWLSRRIWKVQSPTFLAEARTFVRDDFAAQARASAGTFDDAVMAGLVCLQAAHDEDFDPNTNRIIVPQIYRQDSNQKVENGWLCKCSCGNTWEALTPLGELCPECLKKGAKRQAQSATRKGAGRRAVVEPEEEAAITGPTPFRLM